jgi:ectoine hydroxylase-related dioxygenase (phytanoyl-CoA dioxygenase family)
MRLQAGRAYTALQAALSRPPPQSLTEASHQVVLRAVAKVEAAALQLKIMPHLATRLHQKVESTDLADIMQTVREQLPAASPLTCWEKVFNPVATHFQQRLESSSSRSPYYAAAQSVLHRAVPFTNNVLFGQQLHLTCVNGVFLASKMCRVAADIVQQDAHRDWPHAPLMGHKSAGFPVGVLISVMDGGKLHLWPDSLDSAEVSRADMVTVDLNAGHIVLFIGALVHAGAGYAAAADNEGELHFRVHFYTCSTEHRRVWHVSNATVSDSNADFVHNI